MYSCSINHSKSLKSAGLNSFLFFSFSYCCVVDAGWLIVYDFEPVMVWSQTRIQAGWWRGGGAVAHRFSPSSEILGKPLHDASYNFVHKWVICTRTQFIRGTLLLVRTRATRKTRSLVDSVKAVNRLSWECFFFTCCMSGSQCHLPVNQETVFKTLVLERVA